MSAASFRFLGRAALVTGAGSGIGRAIALRLAAEGAETLILEARAEPGEAVATEIREAGGRARVIVADVADTDAMRGAFAGVDRLHLLVNNAGIAHVGSVLDTMPEDFDRVCAVNVKGVYHGLHFGVPKLLASGGGAIVNNASVAGMVGFPTIAPYSAAKHGVIGLTQTAALEYAGQGIRINAICPGYMDTPMTHGATTPDVRRALAAATPAGRLGQPGEVAELAVWLCSSAATFVHGAFIPVDGGVVAG